MKSAIRTQMRVPYLAATIIALLLAAGTPLQAQTDDDYSAAIETFSTFARTQMESDQVPGMVIGFIHNDYKWIGAFGELDIENGTLMVEEGSFRTGSIIKPMTALGILTLVEAGKIDLDAEVQTYLPDFPKKQYPVTIRQLLGHLGGISHYRQSMQEGVITRHMSPRQAIAIFRDWPLVAEPGTEYTYSSYGYNLLGAVIEAVSGQSYSDYMREQVWGPLGMEDTRLDDPRAIIPNRVEGYARWDGGLRNSFFINPASRFSSGGARSTVPDLLKLAEAMLNGSILNDETREMMLTSMQTREGLRTNYGLGWDISYFYSGYYVFEHGGSVNETRTQLRIFPEENFAIAAMFNMENAQRDHYVNTLTSLLLNTSRLGSYTADDTLAEISYAMTIAGRGSLGYYNRHQQPISSDHDEIAAAFASFNQMLGAETLAEDKAITSKYGSGDHPGYGYTLYKVGTYMVDTIATAHGKQRLDWYRTFYIPQIFSDYIALYSQDDAIPAEFRFAPALEEQMLKLAESWQQTWTDEVRAISLMPTVAMGTQLDTLKTAFADHVYYPDLQDKLNDYVELLMAESRFDEALAAMDSIETIYPGYADEKKVNTSLIKIWRGEEDAIPYLIGTITRNQALGLEIYQTADGFKQTRSVEATIQVFDTLLKLQPALGELYMGKGYVFLEDQQNDRAVKNFKKAIELNPDLEYARSALIYLEGEMPEMEPEEADASDTSEEGK